MHVARFLSGLSPTFKSVKSNPLVSKGIPLLSEVFGRLRQADSITTTPTVPSGDTFAFATSMGSGRGGHGG